MTLSPFSFCKGVGFISSWFRRSSFCPWMMELVKLLLDVCALLKKKKKYYKIKHLEIYQFWHSLAEVLNVLTQTSWFTVFRGYGLVVAELLKWKLLQKCLGLFCFCLFVLAERLLMYCLSHYECNHNSCPTISCPTVEKFGRIVVYWPKSWSVQSVLWKLKINWGVSV